MRKLFYISLLITLTVLYAVSFGKANDDELSIKRFKEKERRYALVIGNGAYKKKMALKTPLNDAYLICNTLKKVGFKVIFIKNASHRTMEQSIRNFSRKLQRGVVGLFYYSGHGVQLYGEYYLIPVDAEIENETDVKYEAISISRIFDAVKGSDANLKIFIIDACRVYPISMNIRLKSELTNMTAPSSTIIMYSGASNSVANDRNGRNSIFTKYLAQYIETPGLSFEEIINKVRISVSRESNYHQHPWSSSSLIGEFYFKKTDSDSIDPPQKTDSFLIVRSDIPDATIIVDDSFIGHTPIQKIKIQPGYHNVKISRKGYQDHNYSVTIDKGKTHTLNVSLAPSESNCFRLFVETKPQNAIVRILNIRPKFKQGMKLSPGKYHIKVSAHGYESKEIMVSADNDELNKHLYIDLDKKSASANKQSQKYPKFPWPPPKTLTYIKIPEKYLLANNELSSLYDITIKIETVLDSCGYSEKSYFSIPDGIAIVTRLEQINIDGSPKKGDGRWNTGIVPIRSFSIKDYLNALFTANVGHYRIMVFILTPHPFSFSSQVVKRKEAVNWLSSGMNKPPENTKNISYSNIYTCNVLIYEFEKSEHENEAIFKETSILTGKKHLENAKIWQAFISLK